MSEENPESNPQRQCREFFLATIPTLIIGIAPTLYVLPKLSQPLWSAPLFYFSCFLGTIAGFETLPGFSSENPYPQILWCTTIVCAAMIPAVFVKLNKGTRITSAVGIAVWYLTGAAWLIINFDKGSL